jgi:hypothetical protein
VSKTYPKTTNVTIGLHQYILPWPRCKVTYSVQPHPTIAGPNVAGATEIMIQCSHSFTVKYAYVQFSKVPGERFDRTVHRRSVNDMSRSHYSEDYVHYTVFRIRINPL